MQVNLKISGVSLLLFKLLFHKKYVNRKFVNSDFNFCYEKQNLALIMHKDAFI